MTLGGCRCCTLSIHWPGRSVSAARFSSRLADYDEVARAFRDDVARDSEMMSPRDPSAGGRVTSILQRGVISILLLHALSTQDTDVSIFSNLEVSVASGFGPGGGGRGAPGVSRNWTAVEWGADQPLSATGSANPGPRVVALARSMHEENTSL